MVAQLDEFRSLTDENDVRQFASDYFIPLDVHPEAADVDACIADFPDGKIGVYTRFFDYANYRIPISMFLSNLLNYYQLHISQLHCIGAAKISNFEINCRLLAINPTVDLFRAFYHSTWANGWVSFAKRSGHLQCYTVKVDSLRHWREYFFCVDDVVFPSRFPFYAQGSLPRDERPIPGSYSVTDADTIDCNRIPINSYPEEFLVHMGLSRNYFDGAGEVPTFIDENSQGGCSSFLAFASRM
jgi:hypothetical protein